MKDRIITAIVLLFIMPINMVTIILSPHWLYLAYLLEYLYLKGVKDMTINIILFVTGLFVGLGVQFIRMRINNTRVLMAQSMMVYAALLLSEMRRAELKRAAQSPEGYEFVKRVSKIRNQVFIMPLNNKEELEKYLKYVGI